MNNFNNQTSLDVVKLIKQESLFDGDEDCIVDACTKELSDACKVILEWVVRTPHVCPFNDKGVISKDIRGFWRYRAALMDCVSAVGLIVIQDRDFGDVTPMKMSPIIKKVVDCTKAWLLAMEVSDEEMFIFVTQSQTNFYKLMLSPERVNFEAALNELSRHLHKQLMDAGFREKAHSFKRNSTECFKQIMRICSQAWRRHGTVLLIRLDWGYTYKVPDVRGIFKSSKDYEERFQQVSEYRDKMLKMLRKMYADELAFFVWKIECASVRGLHIHWFIGLNGAKHQDRINVARSIAEKWDEALGLGKENAYTRNINAHQKHETAILRVVDYDDPLLWPIVGGYADYLTKVDYLVRHRTPKGMRSFGSSKFIKAVKKKRGPQRTKEMSKVDLWAVRRPLNELMPEMGLKGAQ